MRLTRVHIDAPLAQGSEVELPAHAAEHLLRVLRLHEGDACVAFNGDGHDYAATVASIGKRGGSLRIGAATAVANESPLAITLVQGVARGEKMDWILQKATELGVAAIVPVFSIRSEVKLDAARADKRLAHWRGVVVAACEQSGRAVLPQVAAPVALKEAMGGLGEGPRWLLDPFAQAAIGELAGEAVTQCTLAVGPEGGWDERDRMLLREAGFQGLRLGPRVLRTETAGIAAISALQAVVGDFR